MTIGDRIKKLRKDKGMTQEELAKYIDSTKQTIYKYENNIITNIPSDKIEKIAKALQTTPSYLMGWDDEQFNIIGVDEKDIKILKERYGSSLREHLIPILIKNETFYIVDESEYNALRGKLIQSHYNSLNPTGQDSIVSIISFLKQLNSTGQKEAVKRVEELTHIEKYTAKDQHLLLNAAHEIEDASEEDKAHDDAIMDDEDF